MDQNTKNNDNSDCAAGVFDQSKCKTLILWKIWAD